MSYTSIPNQPIIFNTQLPEVCEGCGSEFAQLADFNDQLFWQLEAGECGYLRFNEIVVVNDATVDGFNITFPGSNDDTALVAYTFFKFINCLEYKLTITINPGSVGTLIVGFTNGDSVNISAAGTHVIYLKATDIPANTNSNIQDLLIGTNTTVQEFIGSVTIDDFQPNCNGALFAGIVDATTLAVVQVLDPVLTTKDQYLTAGIALADYGFDAGCYRLAIADFCTNTCGQYYIYNPYFNDWGGCIDCPPLGWSSVPVIGADTWNIGGGEAQIDLTVLGNATSLESITELCEDTDYYISIEVDSIANARLRFAVDGLGYGPFITAAGTYDFTITVTQSGLVSLLGSQLGASLDGEITVTRITVRADKNWAKYDKYSDLIQIGDFSDECRFFKIEGCNGENQFGLGFSGTSFLPGIRLEGRRFQPQYDTDTDLFRYASGRWQASFVDRKKKLSYHFGRLPEYVLDFLSIVFYFDNCYVNGELSFPADNEFPTIEYDNADDLGSLTIELYKKREKVRKTVCVGVDADCLPSILDNADEPFILTQDNERITTENFINLYQE
jgi:hypothetical protein